MTCNMCTPEETYTQASHAVENVLFKEDDSGTNRFGREMKKHFYSTVGKWMLGGGAIVVLGLANAYYQIWANEELIQEGGRYTQEEADIDNVNFQRQIDAIAEDIDTIAEYVRKQ